MYRKDKNSTVYLRAVQPVELQHEKRDALPDRLDHDQESDEGEPDAPAQLSSQCQKAGVQQRAQHSADRNRNLTGGYHPHDRGNQKLQRHEVGLLDGSYISEPMYTSTSNSQSQTELQSKRIS